jgi:hypothetical protein
MKDNDPRACAGTALVTLLAIAGFCCIIAATPADPYARWQHAEAHADAECPTEHPTGEVQ